MKIEIDNKFDTDTWKSIIKLVMNQELINKSIREYNVKNLNGLAKLYSDVYQTYCELVRKYGVNTYSRCKLDGYMAEKYDEIEPKCSFDTFMKIIYTPTDFEGIYQLPEM